MLLRGVPFNSTFEDVFSFFKDYEFVPKSLKLGVKPDRRRDGYACMLFKTEEECSRAYSERQGKHIGHRWIELFKRDFAHWKNFDKRKNNDYIPLSSYVTTENMHKILTLFGLPFTANEDDILKFLEGFEIKKSDIVIAKKGGKSTGKAIVFMKSSKAVTKAAEDLDRKYIGERYISVKSASQEKGMFQNL